MLRALALAGIATAFLGSQAMAASIIDNGTIQLGVDDFGQLNIGGGIPSPVEGTTAVGLRFLPTGNEATSHGCVCEGWGVGIGDTFASGSANNDRGVSNLSLISFTSTASTATSVVELTSGELRVTHEFKPATETPNLYRVNVTIENISGVDIADLRYTRTFDWDIEPDTFNEVVTHQGVATTPAVLLAINDGFADSDPFGFRSELLPGGTGDFIDLGPEDHGSNFDFGFGALAAGQAFQFEIFYGAALTEAEILAALGAVSVETFSLGQAASDPLGLGLNNEDDDAPTNTFAFGFAGVGGQVILPNPVPVPAALPLLVTGLAALGLFRWRSRKAAA